MLYHSTTDRIKQTLSDNDCWFESFEHEPVKTSEEASKVRPGYTLNQGAKALILRVKKSEADKRFVMVVIPADQKLDNNKLKSLLGVKDTRFATQEEIAQLTDGIEIGAIPPFGNLFNLEVIVDESLFNNEKIVFNAGDRRFSVAMKSMDYKKLVKPQVAQIIA